MPSSLLEKILALNAQNEIVQISPDGKNVKYGGGIILHREISRLSPEETVRAFLVSRLVNELGYAPQNIELEKPYATRLGRSTGVKSEKRCDIVVNNRDGNGIFLFMELKSPDDYEGKEEYIEGQLFNLSKFEIKPVQYLAYYTAIAEENRVDEKIILIDHRKFKDFALWKNEGYIVASEKIPENYGEARKHPLKKGGTPDLLGKISRPDFLATQRTLHNVLWGGGGTTDTDIFNSLVHIILAKIQDEDNTGDGGEYRFQVKFHGDKPETTDEVLERINALYQSALVDKLEVPQQQARGKEVIDPNKFSPAKLVFAVQRLERYSFHSIRNDARQSDILGEFFERITRGGFKQTKGQFFTPPNIIRFLIYALRIDDWSVQLLNEERRLPYIIDPAAGSGAFLIEAMKIITKTIKYARRGELKDIPAVQNKIAELMGGERENRWAEEYLYAHEYNFDLGMAAKVNMIMHGDGSLNICAGNPLGDGLLSFGRYPPRSLVHQSGEDRHYEAPINGAFDAVISNPPFSIKPDDEKRAEYDQTFVGGASADSEQLFIERWYQLLKPGGRLGVVLPNGIFDGRKSAIRRFLFKYFKIQAIISIPAEVFAPYTLTKTSLFLARKKTPREIEKWDDENPAESAREDDYDFFVAEADGVGFKRTSRKETPDDNDLFNEDKNGSIDLSPQGDKILNILRREIKW